MPDTPRAFPTSIAKRTAPAFTLLAIGFLLLLTVAPALQAQTYSVIHTFSGADGSYPTSTLLLDRAGNLYGTTYGGGADDEGTAFQLKRAGSGWILSRLYSFDGAYGGDGAYPINYGGLVFGPDGAIYGTTQEGGIFSGSQSLGTVFRLQPQPNRCQSFSCPWTNTIIHAFAGYPADGALPSGNVVFDATGNVYGTTTENAGPGSIFELTRSNGGWTESIIPSPNAGPFSAGLAIDTVGNLYGASLYGSQNGREDGSIFQLVPSGSGWTTNILYSFTGGADGKFPMGGVVLDHAGNIYGTTYEGGTESGGTVFQLAPSNGGYTFHLLCSFSGNRGPQSALTIDAAGNLYGTTEYDGDGSAGSAFKVTNTGAGWTCTTLYNFQLGNGGLAPVGGLTVDANGNIFGTASGGGANGNGVIFEITQ